MAIVRDSGLDWTILDPSLLFGPRDGFFNLIAGLVRMSPGVVPITGTGAARFQPLAIDDLARVVVAVLGRRRDDRARVPARRAALLDLPRDRRGGPRGHGQAADPRPDARAGDPPRRGRGRARPPPVPRRDRPAPPAQVRQHRPPGLGPVGVRVRAPRPWKAASSTSGSRWAIRSHSGYAPRRECRRHLPDRRARDRLARARGADRAGRGRDRGVDEPHPGNRRSPGADVDRRPGGTAGARRRDRPAAGPLGPGRPAGDDGAGGTDRGQRGRRQRALDGDRDRHRADRVGRGPGHQARRRPRGRLPAPAPARSSPCRRT